MNKNYGEKWFMFDLARQRSFVREEVELLLNTLSKCGYNGIALYIEGFFQFPNSKSVPRTGCMSPDDAKWIVKEAQKYDIKVIPLTNLVGHAESFLKQEKYNKMKIKSVDTNQFDMLADGFYDFAKEILDQLIECFNPEILHIGGDEVVLSDEDRKNYAKFLSDMQEYLSSKGILTGIWGDMLLKHKDICEALNKDIIVFDWFYYGHRKGSLARLKEMGFKNLFVCPGTQTWNGVVGTQFKCPWRSELEWECDIDVAPDEVEAFLKDGEEANQDADTFNALLTDWENYQGHLMWNGLPAIARFGHYVNNKPLDDEALNNSLFGKNTPYMECVHLLMDAQQLYFYECEKLPGRLLTHCHSGDGIFLPKFLCKILRCGDCISKDTISVIEQTVKKVNEKLDGWATTTVLEERCKKSLRFAACYLESLATVVYLAHNTKQTYNKAAVMQDINEGEYLELLNSVKSDFETFSEKLETWVSAFKDAIDGTGHTKKDLVLLADTKKNINQIILNISEYELNGDKYKENIALISWNALLSEVLGSINLYA